MPNPVLDTSGLPDFDAIKPEHAVPALQELIAAHRQKLAELLADPEKRDSETLIGPLEEMGHALSRAWSPISHLQSVLDDAAWRDAYNESLPLMTEHGTELSQNKALHDAYLDVANRLPADAEPSLRQLLTIELRDFHLAGVDLAEEKKSRYREVAQKLAALQAKFEQNLQDATDAWHWHSAEADDTAGMPASVVQRAAADATRAGETGWRFNLDYPTYHAVMTHADSRQLRETFYRAWSTRASDQFEDTQWDNSETIESIMALRHELAQLVGFQNYAEYSLATKMAGAVEEVIAFLEELALKSRATAERELSDIQAITPVALKAWDIPYFMEKAKQERFAVSDEALRQYFPFAVVKMGMFDLVEKLYGISVRANSEVSGWHATVQYYEIRDAGDQLIGSFYTDLFARNGKRGGAWMDECVIRKRLSGEVVPPVGYLVCNFPPPDDAGTLAFNPYRRGHAVSRIRAHVAPPADTDRLPVDCWH